MSESRSEAGRHPPPRILVADDDATVVASLTLLLGRAGYLCRSAESAEGARALVAAEAFDLVLQDMNFSRQTSGDEGLRLLRDLRRDSPDLPVILMTAWGSIDLAVQGMKLGAADFINKPWSNEQLLRSIETALTLGREPDGQTQEVPTREALESRLDLEGLVGRDPAFLKVLALVERVAPTEAPVLIVGESGTGKELVATAIHRNSRRRRGPFVKVNLGGVSSTLFESEMFGHVRGAFTDAKRERTGRFARADGGTIFLDEIGEVDGSSQVKLLRVLQDHTFEVLGSSTPQTADVRVVSATNADLPELVRTGGFREDLLYRINLITIRLPALRDRRSDIPHLAAFVLQAACRRYNVEERALTPAAQNWLRKQPWPGNVRQLVQTLERAVLVLPETTIDVPGLRSIEPGEPLGPTALPRPGSMTLSQVEAAMIREALEHYDGNLTRVAESLGLSRQALYRRLEKHGLSPEAEAEGGRSRLE